jgi:hypothetical protein
MAKVSDAEMIRLVSAAFDRTVAENAVELGNVSLSIATAFVRAVHDAGMVVVRDERDRSIGGADPAVVECLRQAVPA